MKTAVLGSGSWGTALAHLLAATQEEVCLWGRNAALVETMRQTRQNSPYLPDISLGESCRFESDLSSAISGADVIILAVPSKSFRELVLALPETSAILVSVTKGIEYETGLTMCGILRECLPRAAFCALSGPTLALEVARGIPSAIVAASYDPSVAERVQRLFHRPAFRVYTSTDLAGVEMGGALKNIIAIAAGICDGLGFGDNSKAALITRGIVEMRRLGVACGGKPETFSGLSGLGDLTVTCFSRLSRNRGLGERYARGEPLETILASSHAAEGYPTTRSARHLALQLNVSTPIVDQVYAMLYEGKNVKDALRDLTSRESKAEINMDGPG